CSPAFTLPAGAAGTGASPWPRKSPANSAAKASESRCITATLTSPWCSADPQKRSAGDQLTKPWSPASPDGKENTIMAHEPGKLSSEPESRDARVIPMPVGLGYRPAATPGAPRLSPPAGQDVDQDADQSVTGEVVDVEPVDQPEVTADTGS